MSKEKVKMFSLFFLYKYKKKLFIWLMDSKFLMVFQQVSLILFNQIFNFTQFGPSLNIRCFISSLDFKEKLWTNMGSSFAD